MVNGFFVIGWIVSANTFAQFGNRLFFGYTLTFIANLYSIWNALLVNSRIRGRMSSMPYNTSVFLYFMPEFYTSVRYILITDMAIKQTTRLRCDPLTNPYPLLGSQDLVEQCVARTRRR
jgi:hypothetical protein